ncbi:MAG TPA: CCA tRNA nucleotidyltransferase [Oscillatoriales cyanobacterium M59_W2019_021]|nr:CCA tRNA nucleotidyltransferase [Oscillatoriales cyanobacterium M4454_W2019_049]HIK49514.1 CCA tRNA nucleotidyltransferase [Oscillatoriales cyanobacterium M59_W2019_021]
MSKSFATGRTEGVLNGLLLDLRDRLKPPLWEFINRAAKQAEERRWNLYLVGGIVRDLLVHQFDDRCPILFTDIDLVVDGFEGTAVTNGGIELAKILKQLYPNTRVEIHPKFQTADLIWKHDPEFDSLSIDFATARTEYYPYPGASPVVRASSIRQDLYRRDFTVNAFALQLTQPDRGKLLDFFGGREDLKNRLIRVLHPQSFFDDPTRIYRAVRYTLRLKSELEAQTRSYLNAAIDSGIHRQIQTEQTKVPGVQTRLKKEIKYMLEAPYWQTELKQLANLGALKFIHPQLTLDNRLFRQMQAIDRGLRRFHSFLKVRIDRWVILLELLLTRLDAEDGLQVAANLQLSEDSLDRLHKFYRFREHTLERLSQSQRTSEIVSVLQPHDLPFLILIAVCSSRSIRRKIWQYITQWSQIKPMLNGEDLKRMGYRPSPQFKEILEEVKIRTLDGEFGDRTQAETFVLKNYSPQ